MSLVSLLIVVLIAGLVVWLIRTLPIAEPFKSIAIIVVVVILLVWLLTGFNGFHGNLRID